MLNILFEIYIFWKGMVCLTQSPLRHIFFGEMVIFPPPHPPLPPPSPNLFHTFCLPTLSLLLWCIFLNSPLYLPTPLTQIPYCPLLFNFYHLSMGLSTLTFKLSILGSNPGLTINYHLGFSQPWWYIDECTILLSDVTPEDLSAMDMLFKLTQ